jgi:hypothetical protein
LLYYLPTTNLYVRGLIQSSSPNSSIWKELSYDFLSFASLLHNSTSKVCS